MIKPNFFIVGAPKCGTTAMATYLGEHENVFISNPKEPLFFLDASESTRKVTHKDHYLSLFNSADQCEAVGEASVWYLYSNAALNNIYRFNPDAKIIVFKRNPVDFVASLHSELVFDGEEAEECLNKAWGREKNFKVPESIETIEHIDNWKSRYSELMLHDKYIDRYIDLFGHDQVLVIEQEDMLLNCREVYVRILSFLGVKDDGKLHFPRVNMNKDHRSIFLKGLLHWLPRQRFMVYGARKIKQILGLGTFGVMMHLRKWNSSVQRRTDVDCDTKRSILKKYQELTR